jgi:uncharacterized membrane protein YozB (DUF420 family)
MDAKVVYWTGAWLDFTLLFGMALLAMRRIKQGDALGHRRYMIFSALLVVAFLLSYVVKLMVLGREDMSVWSARDVNVLRFHETCVLVMVVAGSVALWLGRRLRGTRNVTKDRDHELAPERLVKIHKRAGGAAVVGAALGWLSAGFVLLGMYQRAEQAVAEVHPPAGVVLSLDAEPADRG